MIGKVLAKAQGYEEDIIYADIDLAETRKRTALLSKRRPDLYGLVALEADHDSSASV